MTTKYICTDCVEDENQYKTNIYKKFKKHVLDTHKDSEIKLTYLYNCNLCEYKTDDVTKYKRHTEKTKMHDNQPTLLCTICNKKFYTNNNLTEHIRTHSEEVYICSYPECKDKSFSTPNSLRNHVRIVHEEPDRIYTCEKCKIDFDTKSKYDYHYDKFHNEYKCFVCSQICSTKSNFQRHLRDVHNVKSYLCHFDDCEQNYYTRKELNQHIQEIHKSSEKLLFCDECTYYIDTQERLDSHKYYAHPDEKNTYPCIYEYCDYVGQHPSRTKRHVLTKHSMERPLKCQYCEATFKQNENLKNHEAIHRNELIYQCDICEYKTITQSRLTAHKYWHNPNYIYECNLCENKYSKNAHLLRHIDSVHKENGIKIRKKKEQEVADYLSSNNISFNREHYIDFKCVFEDDTCCRIDFNIIYNDVVFFLEVDEYQHDWYSQQCETRRMYSVFQSLSVEGNTLPIVFIRYNPDRYKVKSENVKICKQIRMKNILDFITTFKTTSLFSIKYMYYDLQDDKLDILTNPEYIEDVKEFII
jgi:hypothetical protein